jgi:hypothetical protein
MEVAGEVVAARCELAKHLAQLGPRPPPQYVAILLRRIKFSERTGLEISLGPPDHLFNGHVLSVNSPCFFAAIEI